MEKIKDLYNKYWTIWNIYLHTKDEKERKECEKQLDKLHVCLEDFKKKLKEALYDNKV